MKSAAVAISILLCFVPPSASAQWSGSKELKEILLRMQDMESCEVPLEARVILDFRSPEEQFKTEGYLLRQPGPRGRWYLELDEGRFRAIVDDFANVSFWLPPGEATAKQGDLGVRVGRSDLILADLGRFVPDQFKEPRILDENLDEIQVGVYPILERPYIYRVYTIDKKRNIAVKIQYFAGQLNNLVKVRLDSGHVLVYGKWLPGTISIKDFSQASETTLTLAWSVEEDLAEREIFQPQSLARPSPLRSKPAGEEAAQ